MLKDKTALVTGSTSGIGQGIAQAFAARGANIILNGFGDAARGSGCIPSPAALQRGAELFVRQTPARRGIRGDMARGTRRRMKASEDQAVGGI